MIEMKSLILIGILWDPIVIDPIATLYNPHSASFYTPEARIFWGIVFCLRGIMY